MGRRQRSLRDRRRTSPDADDPRTRILLRFRVHRRVPVGDLGVRRRQTVAHATCRARRGAAVHRPAIPARPQDRHRFHRLVSNLLRRARGIDLVESVDDARRACGLLGVGSFSACSRQRQPFREDRSGHRRHAPPLRAARVRGRPHPAARRDPNEHPGCAHTRRGRGHPAHRKRRQHRLRLAARGPLRQTKRRFDSRSDDSLDAVQRHPAADHVLHDRHRALHADRIRGRGVLSLSRRGRARACPPRAGRGYGPGRLQHHRARFLRRRSWRAGQ